MLWESTFTSGNSAHSGNVLQTTGCLVQQCNFDITWEMLLKARYSNYNRTNGGMGSSSFTQQTPRTHTVTVTFGVKIVGNNGTTYWLDGDVGWNEYETDLEASARFTRRGTGKTFFTPALRRKLLCTIFGGQESLVC